MICETKKVIQQAQEKANVQQIQGALNQSALLPLSKTTCKDIIQAASEIKPSASILTFF